MRTYGANSMKALRFSTLAMVAGSLAFSVPAFAAKPVTGKVVAKPAGKPGQAGPKKDRPLIPYETDCAEFNLPNNFVPYIRHKPYPNEPWLGLWMWVTPKGGTKVTLKCHRYEKGDFKKVFATGLAQSIKTMVAGWKQQQTLFDKDGPRNVGVSIGTGWMKRIDPKTKKSVARPHILAQFFRRSPDRNLQVRLTIATTAGKLHRLEKLVDVVGKSLSVVDKNDKKQIRKKKGLVK